MAIAWTSEPSVDRRPACPARLLGLAVLASLLLAGCAPRSSWVSVDVVAGRVLVNDTVPDSWMVCTGDGTNCLSVRDLRAAGLVHLPVLP